jgi:phosphoglycolate phosphatase
LTRKRIHKKLIIFDLDGTLIDSGHDLANSLNYTLKHMGITPLPQDEIFSQVGNGVSMIIKRLLGPGREHIYKESLEVFLRHYEKHILDNTLPYPGVSETLISHNGNFRFALLTNKPLYLTEIILQDLSLDSFFELTLGGDSFQTKKPDPQGILSILEQTGTGAEEAVIVGDSINDVLAGRSSGVVVIGVRYGLGAEVFEMHPPDHLINTFPELFELVHPV